MELDHFSSETSFFIIFPFILLVMFLFNFRYTGYTLDKSCICPFPPSNILRLKQSGFSLLHVFYMSCLFVVVLLSQKFNDAKQCLIYVIFHQIRFWAIEHTVTTIEHLLNYILYCRKVFKAASGCLLVFIWLKRCSRNKDSGNLKFTLSQPTLFVLYQQDLEACATL